MEKKQVVVTGKYTSSSGLWKITAARNGRKATSKGLSFPRAHRAAIAALDLMERISKDDGKVEDVPLLPVDS